MQSKKRRRVNPPTIHPRNRYSEKPPDFALLSSLYPSFRPYVFPSSRPGGRPSIDWTDFNATRELTRVLLSHDHSVNWWIPDGQLCPTVPNRSNYIHWIEDLLSSELIPPLNFSDKKVTGFDIGAGANCIYPLLGASLFGWSFVGSDVTDVALEWAAKNVESNPHLSELIEIRNANNTLCSIEDVSKSEENIEGGMELSDRESLKLKQNVESHPEAQVLLGVVKVDEKFDFCMCNPPFFESIDEAGLNPKTSCGGTMAEMVYPGGEQAFIMRIISDSVVLKNSFRWFTSMVGRKANLKVLISKLREIGVSIVKTTEFVQGQTARWGLAWSFVAPKKNSIILNTPIKSHHSFTLQGLPRQLGAFQILKAVESFYLAGGAACKLDVSSFSVKVDSILPPSDASNDPTSSCNLSFHVSVFEQTPGTLLVRGSLLQKNDPLSGMFSSLFLRLEDSLKNDFVNKSRLN
ncbi:U6 small nuclear RNA (adenine-(43)-N(6))-methyltransferase-like [Zingiber officinale]|uniref:U6 small nuclear RNA (adenine-(43)-N(6))-methyltransferase-like n=1 Tax=Zingiber officinale TaxID=94328 RepID=UPI001C4CB1CC|nr:U6 small nuclear RNA (adenine-(43)-N(6))-methyltransferase-like [Zingiber officinale]